MPIQLLNKTKFKEKFRLVDNPKIVVQGVVNEPPEEIRYSNNAVVRMLEVGHCAIDLQGKQIRHTGKVGACYLIGEFLARRESSSYRAFEVTHYNQLWTRQLVKNHPVTNLPTSEFTYQKQGDINVCVLYDNNPVRYDQNPTQYATLRSSDEIKAGDIVGDFLIRDVRVEYGLYCARAEYQTVKPNG